MLSCRGQFYLNHDETAKARLDFARAVSKERGLEPAIAPLTQIYQNHLSGDFDTVSIPAPSAVPAYRTAETAAIAAMTGTWPNPQTPTCQQIYGNTSPNCPANPNISPWDIFLSVYIQGQDVHKEMFVDAFQNCSGYELFSVSANNAKQSIYMKPVWT